MVRIPTPTSNSRSRGAAEGSGRAVSDAPLTDPPASVARPAHADSNPDDSGHGSARDRANAVRARADELLVRSAELVDRSRALRLRLGRPDWTEVSVLNVEDNEPARFLRTRILENAGYTIREAESAADAVDAAAQPEIKLVLLDVGLPDADGFEVCERIKASRLDVPV